MINLVETALAFVWIALIPIQDSLLQSTAFRFSGASLGVLALAPLIAIAAAKALSLREARRRGIARALWAFLYAVAVTTAYLIIYEGSYPGLFLAYKAVKYGLLLFLFVAAALVVPKQYPSVVRWATYAAFLICATGVLCGDILHIPQVQYYFHFTRNLNMRPRGLAVESSTLGIQAATLGLLSAYFATSVWARGAAAVLCIGLIGYSGSKGSALALAAALLLAVWISPPEQSAEARIWGSLARIALPASLVAVGAASVLSALGHTFRDYTSGATRLTAAAAAAITVLRNPFGVGLGGMLPALSRYLPGAIDLLHYFKVASHFSEVRGYIGSSTGIDVDTKSFFLNQAVYFGLPFILLYIGFHVQLFRRLARHRAPYWLIVATAFSLIAITCYSSGVGLYNVSLVYGVAIAFIRHAEAAQARSDAEPDPGAVEIGFASSGYGN